jgi:predicted DNA-binding transcriptional regulator AlpA
MDFGDVLLEPKEAAAFLKVSLSWLVKARATNDGPPFVRIGRCVRYSKAALLRWIKSRER